MRMSQSVPTLFDLPPRNGEANKIVPEDLPIHDWYRFVLSFPPHLVREYINRFDLDGGSTLLDPFCGTGTSIVECQKQGIHAVGMEALPMPAFASRVKTSWEIDRDGLLEHSEKITEKVTEKIERQGVPDDPELPVTIDRKDLMTLPHESFRLLLKDSISPLPLHKALTLLEEIQQSSKSTFGEYQLLALAKALVTDIGNIRFGPEVGLGIVKANAWVIQPWIANIRAMARDLSTVPKRPKKAIVHQADSRSVDRLLAQNSVDAVFTSPPYPNEKDYTRTTRLETVILGLARDMAELRGLKRTLVRSNTRGVYKDDMDDELVRANKTVQDIAERIEKRRIEMGKTSGFERLYHRVTKLYFGGMSRHLESMRRVLKPGALLGYVVGDQASYLRIMIRTAQLLGEIAESLGYRVEGIEVFRTRLATATREQLREEVLILRWRG